ncbi:metallophosphoesterase family protein [Arsenicicoccus dermatophilus]|uniref:metallophosphoesterase family protein n=1 Tax=Arsenicicoccus dermatophilus TaxID=1076331 RepID=UPI0039170424
MRVLVLADTHSPRRWKALPEGLREPLAAADLVLHAGDVCEPSVLDTLAAYAPVHVVLGNNDGADVAAWGATETLELELGGVLVAMIHDAGPRGGRAARMHRRFPQARLVVYGHSHIPLDEPEGPVHLFNPGSPTDRRRQPVGTYGLLELTGGRVVRSEIVPLPADQP